ncbi:MAG: hypothetical protein WBS18_12770 [Candidatus Acidiferrales bacterium]
MNLRKWWRAITTLRYTKELETEVARLRAENRAMLNSILGIAGVPPVVTTESPAREDAGPGEIGDPGNEARQKETTAPARAAKNGRTARSIAGGGAGSAAGRTNGAALATPTRRRSWQQITRMLEIEAARKREPVETEQLPTARFGTSS